MGASTLSPARRFLVLGLDGGTFELLDPLMEAGDLPFLRSMAKSGVKAPLTSVYPAKTIPRLVLVRHGSRPGRARDLRFHRAGRRPRVAPSSSNRSARPRRSGTACRAPATRSAS